VYGPKGVGALWVRRSGTPRVRLAPLVEGGGQERGLRSGTVPVPLVVGFGEACAVAEADLHDEMKRIGALRDRLLGGLSAKLEAVEVNGSLERRLPGNLNVSFAGIEGEALLTALKHLAVSSGSACTSGTVEPSYVLKALGLDNERALTALRFGIGRFNTEDEIDRAVDEVVRAVTRLRVLSPVWEMRKAGIDPAQAWKSPEGP
jgi:cysteine desulfurase